MGIPFYIITGPVQLLNNGFLLFDRSEFIEPDSKILLLFPDIQGLAPDTKMDGQFELVVKITEELLLLLPSQPADFLHPFGLGHGAAFDDRFCSG